MDDGVQKFVSMYRPAWTIGGAPMQLRSMFKLVAFPKKSRHQRITKGKKYILQASCPWMKSKATHDRQQ